MRGITASWMVFVIVAFVATFGCPVLRCPFCWRGYIIAKNDNQYDVTLTDSQRHIVFRTSCRLRHRPKCEGANDDRIE
uniref:Uncharacterized protein n=1 Tax=Magallana gigas TaxID=29159 RepID=K1RLU5_MAGGI